MQIQRLKIQAPVIQIAIDLTTIDEALRMAELGVKAGVDWLEAGTPLIVRRGADAIGAIARAFPAFPVLADYKTMDSGGKNVMLTAEQGGRIMTVCAGACDETIASAVAASKETGVLVIVDTIGVRDQVGRAREVERLGADSVYLHYGADQRRADATRDSTQWAAGVGAAIKVPLGVGTFGVEDGVRAASMGAEVIVIGHPLISGPDPLGALREYCQRVREAYRPRRL
ncbi:MAG TPA: orotidine 5'-phosphate decarboxylase / HUMPS family protein [Humisphaera sp.]|nr:orotidine 5'-phosphate decarboxylase / HUMPS family protein [Humisphaera sp.]